MREIAEQMRALVEESMGPHHEELRRQGLEIKRLVDAELMPRQKEMAALAAQIAQAGVEGRVDESVKRSLDEAAQRMKESEVKVEVLAKKMREVEVRLKPSEQELRELEVKMKALEVELEREIEEKLEKAFEGGLEKEIEEKVERAFERP